MKINKNRVTIKRLLFFYLLFLLAVLKADPGAAFTERDQDCLLVSVKNIHQYPENSFFIFCGLDEKNNILCEPVSGARQIYTVKPNLMRKTGYYKDTHSYEVAVDGLQLYADRNFWRESNLQAQFMEKRELLRVLGGMDCLQSACNMKDVQDRILRYMKKVSVEWKKMSRASLKYEEELRKKTEQAKDCFSCSPSSSLQEENEAEERLKTIAADAEEYLQQEFGNIETILMDSISTGDELQTIAVYINVSFFFYENRNLFVLHYRKENILSGCSQNLKERMQKLLADILNKTADCYQDQQEKLDFLKLFPNAKGVWSENRPVTAQDLLTVFQRYFIDRKMEKTFSYTADFENWGNCRLTALMFSRNVPEAAYLGKEFREALNNYKRNFKK